MERNPARTWHKSAGYLFFFGCLGLLADCSHLTPKTAYTSTYHRGCSLAKVWQSCPSVSPTGLPGVLRPDVAPFHSIRVAGPFNVALRPDRGGPDVVIHGDASVIGRTNVFVKDSTLIIRVDRNFAYDNSNRANVDIRMGSLAKIYFDSPGDLVATGIRSTRLMVIANHRARVRLAGAVRNLDVVTYENARVDVKDLKVKKNLSAAASGASRIYHSEQPANRNSHPRPSGAIVRMGGLKVVPECTSPPCHSREGSMPKDMFADDVEHKVRG